MATWKECELGSVVTLQRGYDLPQQKRVPGSVPIFSSSGISGYHNQAMEKAPGVITGRYGTIGQVFLAEDEYWPLNTTLFVKDFHDNDPAFIYYFLKTIPWTKHAAASAVPGINRNTVHKEQVSIPDIDTQKKIAAVLSTFDQKININQKINDNLQQQTFAMFDHMVANADEPSCTVAEIAFLNPYRELKKSTVARCVDMAKLSTSGSYPDGWETKPYSGGMKFCNGDTLLARITPCLENGKTAFVNFLNDGEVGFGSTEYIVMSPKDNLPPELLYCLARYPAFVDYAVKNMNGSSGRQRVSAETIGKFIVPIFSQRQLDVFSDFARPAFETIRINSEQNNHLRQIRDALLPKLMSGEIDPSAIELSR